jgi:porphobilinogen synthase
MRKTIIGRSIEMGFPQLRMRRLRENPLLRRLISETKLSVDDLILPIFVVPGERVRQEISSMPEMFRFSIDELLKEMPKISELGLPGILLFGVPKAKDERGTEAYDEHGVVQEAIRAIKCQTPELLVITDVCLCGYTSHGHCGVVGGGRILNDPTLKLLAQVALSHVRAGADMVAPSDMMDGRVGAIRQALDEEGYTHIPIMSYAAKYASNFYGPFREAAECPPQFGDRKSYQMDPSNALEALREVRMDIEEGADIVMIKPALCYLDIISRVKQEFAYPVAAYNVSGEYSMVKAAAQKGWINEKDMVLEILTSIKRAGADIILTYHALDAARWL